MSKTVIKITIKGLILIVLLTIFALVPLVNIRYTRQVLDRREPKATENPMLNNHTRKGQINANDTPAVLLESMPKVIAAI